MITIYLNLTVYIAAVNNTAVLQQRVQKDVNYIAKRLEF